MFGRFFTVKFLFSSPFHVVLSGGRALCTVHSVRRGEVGSPFLGAGYLHTLFGILHGRFVSSLLFIQLSNHLFISVWTHRCWFYILGYNPLLLYFVAHIIPALTTGSPFSQCSHFFDILSLVSPLPAPHAYRLYALLLFESSSRSGATECSRLSLYFSCPDLESAMSLRSPGSFY